MVIYAGSKKESEVFDYACKQNRVCNNPSYEDLGLRFLV